MEDTDPPVILEIYIYIYIDVSGALWDLVSVYEVRSSVVY